MDFTSPHDPYKFEDFVKCLLENNYGYGVIKPSKGTFGYDLEVKITRQDDTNLSEDGESGDKPPDRPKVVTSSSEDGPLEDERSIAVQIKNFKRPVNSAEVKKFIDFMGLFRTQSQFSEGWLISASGFAKAAIKHLRNESENPNASVISLGTIFQGSIRWDYLHPKSSFHAPQGSSRGTGSPVSPLKDHQSNIHVKGNTHKEKLKRYYFGIFTNKGGTGKTTVAAHLAGAFALRGYDVILVDIDPQRNLKKLFQEDKDDLSNASLFVPSLRPGQVGCTISVLDDKEWEDDKDNHNDIKIVICDCNPTFEENSSDLVKEFDYCVIPITLNPLGIAKNGDVVKRTFEKVRIKNNKAEMFVLINCFENQKGNKGLQKKNERLLDFLKEKIKPYFDKDEKCHLIDPIENCAIHRSIPLYYWGMHIIEKEKPHLAFELHGGKCVPREDFLKLAEYFRGKFEEL